MILSGATTPGQSGSGSNGSEGVFRIPTAHGLEPHHQMQCSVLSKTLVGEDVLPLCRDAVGVFYTPNRLGQ